MKKSLIQKISEKGKKGIVAGALVGALGLAGASLSGCAGPQIRTEPISDPYGNVKLTELGKQFQKEYGFDMYSASGGLKPKPFSFKSYSPGKGKNVFYPGETVYFNIPNFSQLISFKIANKFKLNLKGLTTGSNRSKDIKINSFGPFRQSWTKIRRISHFPTTPLYEQGLKQGYHTTDWEIDFQACRNGENAPCDSLGSIYFSVTDKK